jgi:hypothetical protein
VVGLENNIIAFVIAIRNFLKGLNDSHLNSFLANWPSPNCKMRSVSRRSLPILSWMPVAVKAAGKQTELVVNRLAALANHLSWGQTYSAQDLGAGFLEKNGWMEFIGLRGFIFRTSNRIFATASGLKLRVSPNAARGAVRIHPVHG